MSLKSRLQKSRESKTFSFTQDETDCDLLAYFKEHPDIDSLTVYSHDKIYSEKNGITTQLLISFSSESTYLAEIERICRLYDAMPSDKNPHVIINMANNVVLDIYTQPMVTSQPFLSFSRKNSRNYENCFSEKLLSTEIVLYLRECLEKQVNIFIIGNASVDKTSIMNVLANLPNSDKKLVICEKGDKITTDKPCCIRFSKSLLNNAVNLQYDNIFTTDLTTDELINVFKLIISGYNGFVVSLSVKNNVDILPAIRNMLLLSNINLFEENADFMATASMDVVISTEKTESGLVRITKISEMSKNKANDVVLKDIFVWSKAGYHLSTGNISRYFNAETSKRFEKDYLEESHKHRYINAMLANCPIENKVFDSKNKLKKLKDKLKSKKLTENQNNIAFAEKFSSSLNEEKSLPSPEMLDNESKIEKDQEKFDTIVEAPEFVSVEPDENSIETETVPLNIEPTVFENSALDEVVPSSNEGVLASESDDFSDDTNVFQPKIRNILDEINSEEEEIPEEPKEEISPPHFEDFENKEIQPNLKNFDAFVDETPQIVEEPQLFEEIKDVNIDDFEEDDDIQITEDDI